MMTTLDPAMHGSITFYSASIYPVFDQIGPDAAREAAQAAGSFMAECAPYKDKKGNLPKRDIPHFGERSIIYAIALSTAYLAWTFKGRNLPDSPLLDAAMDGYRLHTKTGL